MKTPYQRKTDTFSRIEMDLKDPHFAFSVTDEVGIRRFLTHQVEVIPDRLTRVKAVLRFPQHGVEESYFQLAQSVDEIRKSALTQFRMRAFSKSGSHTKWMYSNLVTGEGERVIFELLAEIADNLDWLSDKDLEFLLESFAEDLYLERILERGASPIRNADLQESIKMGMKEELKRAVTGLQSFKETLISNPQEIATIYKLYETNDSRGMRQDDFLQTVIASYLEEKMDFKVDDFGLGAYGEGDEPFAYAQELFDFVVRGEFLKEEWSPFAKDHAFFYFKDVASLLNDPLILEMMKLETQETFIQTFLFALETTMGLSEDHLVLELFNLVEDLYEQGPETPSILIEQDENKIQLLYEVLSLIFRQQDQLLDVNPEIASHLMYRFMMSDQRLLFTRDESEKQHLSVGEVMTRTGTKENNPEEERQLDIKETVDYRGDGRKHLKEDQSLSLGERLERVLTMWEKRKEQVTLHLIDAYKTEETSHLLREEGRKVGMKERLRHRSTKQIIGEDLFAFRLVDRFLRSETLKEILHDKMSRQPLEDRVLLYKMNPLSHKNGFTLERGVQSQLEHEFYDRFIGMEHEFVQYAVGEEYSELSVGEKTLGDITL